jgi:type I restriction enzyme S subunit
MSVPKYPEYRDSGVEWLGEVPKHWDISRFKQVFKERNERSTDGLETLLSVSAYTGVLPRSEIVEEGEHLSRAESLEGYKICHPGDLVMNIMLAWNRGLGFTIFHGIASPSYCVFEKIDNSDCKFLDYLVRSNEYTGYFKAFSTGVIESRLRLYPEIFGQLYVSIPRPEEQSAIAAFLDHETAKIDTLVAEQEKLIELLKEKRQAVISHAVTKGLDPNVPMKDSGVEWLGEVPEHWDVCRLGYRYEVALGKMLDEKRISGAYLKPYLRNVDVQWDIINTENLPMMDFHPDERGRYILQPGDLLVCEGGEVGRAAMWNGILAECYYQKALHRIRPREQARDFPRFLFYLLRTAVNFNLFTGWEGRSTIAHLTAETLRGYRFPFPPAGEQESIFRFLDGYIERFQALECEAQNAITLLKERRSALISAAVTGKIDVRGLVEPVSENAMEKP